MTLTNKSQEMWRSKLGNDYANDFMEVNEAKLLKKLHQIRDQTPENRLCADCGTRGTVWASVNLGVFLCLTCGSHHRSLGTHISKPKGCTGTYWWGPDEIERMSSIGNAKAKVIYGTAGPPPGITTDNSREWKEYLMDKYVHRKFAAPKKYGRPAAKENRDDDLNFFFRNSSGNGVANAGFLGENIQPATKQSPTRFGQGNNDLISFEENLDTSKSASSSSSGGGPPSKQHTNGRPSMPQNPTSNGWQQNPTSAGTPTTNSDFFAQFGL